MLYLACPYSHPNAAIRDERFRIANRAASKLMQSGIVVFSPLSHSVTISESFDDNVRLSHEFWMSQDLPILRRCDEMLVLRLAGWYESLGVKAELFEAIIHDIPITLICEHDIDRLPAIPKQSCYFLTSKIFTEINS